jgi:hypothetical protein
MPRPSALLLPLLSLTALSGCLINHESEVVIDREAPRAAVNFENDEAMTLFQEEIARRKRRGDASLGKSGFAIPFIIATSEKRVLSENAFYNQQVEIADVNRDGWISLAEAKAYGGK